MSLRIVIAVSVFFLQIIQSKLLRQVRPLKWQRRSRPKQVIRTHLLSVSYHTVHFIMSNVGQESNGSQIQLRSLDQFKWEKSKALIALIILHSCIQEQVITRHNDKIIDYRCNLSECQVDFLLLQWQCWCRLEIAPVFLGKTLSTWIALIDCNPTQAAG